MGMSIKNAEVERLARTLAKARKISLTEAIRQALARELEREIGGGTRKWDEAKYQRLKKIVQEAASLPVIDDRSEDEILGYDEFGIPTR